MKSTKTNKGITLVALIITIVVLLILAAVAISSITNDGILHYAQNAASSYNQAQRNEAGILEGYLDYLDQQNQKMCPGHQFTGGGWDDELGVGEDGEPYGGYRPTKCAVCGLICEHDGFNDWDVNEVWTVSDDVTCYPSYYCKTCGMQFDNETSMDEDHEYENGVCSKCGHACVHDIGVNFSSNDDGTHNEIERSCGYCGIQFDDIVGISCDIEGDGFCDDCGYACSHVWEDGICTVCDTECEHQNMETVYRKGGSGWHKVDEVCTECNLINEDIGDEDCVDDDEDGYCDYCEADLEAEIL